MTPTVVHLNGPLGSGKSTLVEILASRRVIPNLHHVRFELNAGAPQPTLRVARLDDDADPVGRSRCVLSRDLVFEQVPEELRRIADDHPDATIVVETDGDPCFRHAYPFDVKLFVMAPPTDILDIFRSSEDAAAAVERALHDTAAFAEELFGLPRETPAIFGVPDVRVGTSRPAGGATQTVEEFMQSEVGKEITARMQLQTHYHPILDSDVILMNAGLGDDDDIAALCADRIDTMVHRMRRQLGREAWFACCDPLDSDDPLGQRCLERIESLVTRVRATHE